MPAIIKGCGQTLLFLGVIALALVSISAPLVPRISFLSAQFVNDVTLSLGCWGGCVNVGTSQTCPGSKLGYSITLNNFPGKTGNGPEPIGAGLTYAMILFPLAGFAGLLAFVTSLSRRSRFAHYTAVCLCMITFLSSAAGLIFALIIFIRALQRVNDQFSPASPASLGPAVWISIVAVICVAFGGLLIAGNGAPATPASKKHSASHSQQIDRFAKEGGDHYTVPQQFGSYTRPRQFISNKVPFISEPQLQHQGMQMTFESPNEGSYHPSEDNDDDYIDEKSEQYHATSYYGEEPNNNNHMNHMRSRSSSKVSRSDSRASRSGSKRWH